ncbi:elongation factor P maturation arginine rhamnosyltransferase EarP [Cupriavidus basilensis]|uniref:Protein-arginine rhamnosyltransferase n=1 Tax=Cupriavidus basilensis TaxID=68895 RepID=A0ABT6ASF3_9BURK|nr:elongation factor P maturation arginine rhamnosyltransferase EarP [Cupriavidus basilensis]MDF3835318.1 elongation factor P maturation arginine rhamnosyltransferase EarP [Cupriavidus basilensis]
MPAYSDRAIRSWDIFCTVIDNFGDIGVCWRLARQLAQEHGHAVRLWVDDFPSFARLAPGLDTGAAQQELAGVTIRPWQRTDQESAQESARRFAGITPHDVVIESFACDLPEPFLDAMAIREPKPLWINLEYLSAEPWVREHHGMTSPHPRLPLLKHFFFPGFEPGTGGLLRETMLGAQREHFRSSPAAQAALWHRLGFQPVGGALKVSLFAYPNDALPALLAQWRDGPEPVQCLVPAGLAARQASIWAGATGCEPGNSFSSGNLTLQVVPFVRQEHYDELLWLCDLNFVRGEDSFVRAQWAGRPFVWHIYPQSDDAHRIKLDAFLALFRQRLERTGQTEAENALTSFWHSWNGGNESPEWPALRVHLATLADAAEQWQRSLQHLGDLAANLAAFCENQVK